MSAVNSSPESGEVRRGLNNGRFASSDLPWPLLTQEGNFVGAMTQEGNPRRRIPPLSQGRLGGV